MINKIRNYLGKKYVPLNKIEISKKALIANYSYLSSQNPTVKIAPVLKSNAYGHGLVKVAKILDGQDAPMFCVDSLFEAYELLKSNIKTHIFIMGYIHPLSLKVKKLPFSYAVYSHKQLEVIDKYQPSAKVHLKLDSGMHRLGIPADKFDSFVSSLKNYKNIQVEGIMSHIAYQQDLKNNLSIEQLEKFKIAQVTGKRYGVHPKWSHIGASWAAVSKNAQVAKVSNLARVGLALYGISSTSSSNRLKPTLKLTSQIVQIKKLKAGDKIGYSGTFVAKGEMKIGVLPIGYNDGVDRRLSNKGYVLVNNHPCKIVGLINMNITTIDLSKVDSAKVGGKVQIYSNKPNDPNSISNAAKLCKTIPYELLVKLQPNAIKREITP